MDIFSNRIMLSGELAAFIGDNFDIPTGSVLDRAKPLRDAELLSKNGHGPRSGARMTNADAVNSILANVLDHKRGENIATAVRRVRALRPDESLSELPIGFSRGLACFEARSAGTALDALLADIRTGRLATWANGERYELQVTLDSRGQSVLFSLTKPQRHALDYRSAIQGFATPAFLNRTKLVERTITIGGDVFLKLAAALGPLPES